MADLTCPHGCEDGWVYVQDCCRACECQREAARARRVEGQRQLTKRKRRQCRKAGVASGRRRRALARGRRTLQGRELPLTWSVRQVTRSEFERLYRRMCARERLPVDTRGLNTAYELYRIEIAAYHAQGQDFETTNGQRQAALLGRGRPRCRRTVQLTRKRLVAMRLIAYCHIRRGGWREGQRDTLRVHVLFRARANCTPPTGTEQAPLRGPICSVWKAGVPPPTAADEVGSPSQAQTHHADGDTPAPARSPGERGVQLAIARRPGPATVDPEC